MPGGREGPEMIQPNYIHVGQYGAYPVDPPRITSAAEGLPVVDRIAPQLSLSAEVIGWHTRHKARPTMFVEEKKFWVSPYVARIGRDEEGKVADQPDALGPCILFQPVTLAEQ